MSPRLRISKSAFAISAVAAIGAVSLGGLPAVAETPPGLSITIDNGATKTAPDTDVTYETTLSNAGTDAVTATVIVTVPQFATIDDAPDAAVDGVNATWSVSVDPGSSKTLTATAHIGSIPDGEYRVTTLASVYLGETTDGPPLIRSADSDKIPGVVDPVVNTSSAADDTQDITDNGWVALAAVGGGALVLALAGLIVRRARRKRGTRRAARRSIRP